MFGNNVKYFWSGLGKGQDNFLDNSKMFKIYYLLPKASKITEFPTMYLLGENNFVLCTLYYYHFTLATLIWQLLILKDLQV